eukprot:CAMPEP_0197673442 /NCGR_PEP_ID=MMETSP1338-20131121/80940_1 /TAXON_ID=43686 ORGANISM="Pelagodinium beii, Strain RCC1491" /NCGR_SAMPLE_ID=MMETSP1338 /ASSEMBLY_ACC=CAM_ASM_000754 /LENGTH=85 /DNA_ID=CAMNT_0043253695 /DNA_START=368 /DNA_END=625 /DNA_ORIENTATION=+
MGLGSFLHTLRHNLFRDLQHVFDFSSLKEVLSRQESHGDTPARLTPATSDAMHVLHDRGWHVDIDDVHHVGKVHAAAKEACGNNK